jgi:hypothetical protein
VLATLCALAYIAYWNTPAFENFWALFDTPLVIFEIGLSVLLLVKPLQRSFGSGAEDQLGTEGRA